MIVNTREIFAYCFGARKDAVFKTLQDKLSKFDIDDYYTDDCGAYSRNLPAAKHIIEKSNTQPIEPKYLTLRTSIKRLAKKQYASLS